MVIALEYMALFDDVSLAAGAIDTTNEANPETGWKRSFNLGSRRTVAVGLKDGKIQAVVGCVGDILHKYYLTNLEPMPEEIFYSTVKTLFLFNGVRFVEKKWGTRKVMFLSDEVEGIA